MTRGERYKKEVSHLGGSASHLRGRACNIYSRKIPLCMTFSLEFPVSKVMVTMHIEKKTTLGHIIGV